VFSTFIPGVYEIWGFSNETMGVLATPNGDWQFDVNENWTLIDSVEFVLRPPPTGTPRISQTPARTPLATLTPRATIFASSSLSPSFYISWSPDFSPSLFLSSSPDPAITTPTDLEQKLSTGALSGIIVGSIAFLFAAIMVVFVASHRRASNRQEVSGFKTDPSSPTTFRVELVEN
jgi:hypothetical protein